MVMLGGNGMDMAMVECLRKSVLLRKGVGTTVRDGLLGVI